MSIFIHMAPYVVSKGYGYEAGALLVSVYGMGAFAGRPVWGTMIGRLGVHRTLVVYTATYAAIVVAFILPTTMPPLYAIALLLGIAVAGGQQLQGQAFPDYFGREIVGTLQGYAGLAYTLSRAFGPLYAAVVFDVTQSYVISFASFAAASFLASACFFFAPPPKHPSTVEAPPVPAPAR
jgi:MFS family permease